MTFPEASSLIASIVSVILGAFAIWLSIVFYKMSILSSEKTNEAAKGISASVERLEKLFDKMYADTFSVMRDTVTDIRKHMWPDDSNSIEKAQEEAEKKADERIQTLKKQLSSELEAVLKKQEITDAKLHSISNEMGKVVNRAISESRKAEIEAREETVRQMIMRVLRNRARGRPYPAEILVSLVDAPTSLVIDELLKMKQDGLVNFEGSKIGPETRISRGFANE